MQQNNVLFLPGTATFIAEQYGLCFHVHLVCVNMCTKFEICTIGHVASIPSPCTNPPMVKKIATPPRVNTARNIYPGWHSKELM